MQSALTKEQNESIYFYVRSDFLLINNILWDDKDNLDRSIVTLFNEHKGMISEAKEQGPAKRFGVSEDQAHEIMQAYERRTPEEFNQKTRELMIQIAKGQSPHG